MMSEEHDKQAPPPSYDEMGGSYSHTQTTTTTAASSPSGLGFNKNYVRTIPGILKIVQAVASLACMICSFIYMGGIEGWCGFVSGTAFFCSLVWFFLYLFNVSSKFPPFMSLIEFIYYIVLSVFYFIAFILACVWAGRYYNISSQCGAYAFFSVIALVAFIVDTFFQFKLWRAGVHSSQSHTQTTVTTTTEVRY